MFIITEDDDYVRDSSIIEVSRVYRDSGRYVFYITTTEVENFSFGSMNKRHLYSFDSKEDASNFRFNILSKLNQKEEL